MVASFANLASFVAESLNAFPHVASGEEHDITRGSGGDDVAIDRIFQLWPEIIEQKEAGGIVSTSGEQIPRASAVLLNVGQDAAKIFESNRMQLISGNV